MRVWTLSAPNCGHHIPHAETEAEAATLGFWVCPMCGFQVPTPGGEIERSTP